MSDKEEPVKTYGTIKDKNTQNEPVVNNLNQIDNLNQRLKSVGSDESDDLVCEMISGKNSESVDSIKSNESTGYYMICSIS